MPEFSARCKVQISLVVGIALFIVYASTTAINLVTNSPVFIPLPSADTAPAALLPISLLRDGDLYLDEYAPFFAQRWGSGLYFLRTTQGHLVSHYPMIAAVLAVPLYAAPYWSGWLNDPENAFHTARVAAAALTAGAMALFLLIALEWTAPRKAIALTLALALGTSAWTTASQGLWQHTASLPLLCGALWLLVRGEQNDRLVPWAGLLISLATVARYNNATTAVVLALFVLIRYRERFLAFALLAALPLLALLAYNQVIFGSPFDLGYGAAASGWTGVWWQGVVGLLISPAKGLFVFSPFLLLAAVGSIRSLRQPRSLRFYIAIAGWLFVFVMGKMWGWYGGWSYGNRMLTDSLPLWGVLMIAECERLSRRGWLWFGLATGFAITVHSLGLFDYGVNWHNTYDQGGAAQGWLWDIKHSPILFYAYHYMHRLVDGFMSWGYPR